MIFAVPISTEQSIVMLQAGPTRTDQVIALLECGADNYYQIAKAVGCSAAYVSRVARKKLGRPPKRDLVTLKPARIRAPLVKEMERRLLSSGMSSRRLAKRAGVAVHTLNGWRYHEHDPHLSNFVAVVQALGCELRIVPGGDVGKAD